MLGHDQEEGQALSAAESDAKIPPTEPVDAARSFSKDQRDKLAKSGKAMSDGSFPIVNKQDLKNAIQAYGRASNKAAAKRHIIKRARALGATGMLPDDWAEDSAQDEAATKLYYFEGRNTPIVASSVADARKKKKRGGDKLVKVRIPTAAEKKKMANGEWVRTRKDGKSPEKSKHGKGRGQGPPRDKSSLLACEDCDGRTFLVERAYHNHCETVHGDHAALASEDHIFFPVPAPGSSFPARDQRPCKVCGLPRSAERHT